jgi:hypothetical protein
MHLFTKLQIACHSAPSNSERPLLHADPDTCRFLVWPWRALPQERFCKAANVALVIVERHKELLVGAKYRLVRHSK